MIHLSGDAEKRLDQAAVDHPPHYQANGIEAIDVIEAFGLDFHLGNTAKYVLRAGRKGDAITDLKKARWYLDRAIELRTASADPEAKVTR